MAKKISKKYYIIPAVYFLIVVLLIYMHFGVKKQFSENYLYITLSGTTKGSNKNYESNILSLDVNFYGIKLCFSNSSPLKIESNSGVSKLFITGYQKNSNNIDLFFTDNFKVNISTQKGKETGFIIKPESNFNDEKIKKIAISFDIEKKGTLLKSFNFPVFGYKNDGMINFLTAVGNDSIIDIKQKEISLSPDKRNNFIITVFEAEKGLEDPNTFWLAKNNTDILQKSASEDTAEQLFLENAFKGWRIDRFIRDEGKWLDKNRQLVYSKEIVSALGSELIRRRAVAVNQWIFRLAESRNSEIKYLETALVNGNLVPAYRQMLENDADIIGEITAKIKRNDISVFLIDDLVKIITTRGPYSLAQELFAMADKFNIESPDIKTVVGVASAYLDFVFSNMEKEESLEKFNNIINKIILNKLILNENGLFLITTGDKCETFYTSKAALLLKKAATITERPILERIGDRLVYSIIMLADGEGFLPESIYIDKKSIKKYEGKIEPEYLYPALSSAKYMPSIKPLIEYFPPDTWVATCANSINVNLSANSDNNKLDIETTFPIGETENIILQGIPMVSRISFYGVNWNSTSDFDRYYTGWTYDSETQTLFIKLQHRQEKEVIEILFDSGFSPE